MNKVLEAIKKRRSIRAYEAKQISTEELNAIVEAGLSAPSTRNSQPWHFSVVQNEELLNALNVDTKEMVKNSPIEFQRNLVKNPDFNVFYGAPTAIYVSAEKEAMEPLVDVSAAIQNMLVAAESLNIGSCWLRLPVALFKGPKAAEYKEKLQIPNEYEPAFIITFGYKKQEVGQAPKRREGLVNYIK